MMATLWMAVNQLPQAREELENAAVKFPTDPESYLKLGDLAEDTGIIEKARALAKAIVDKDPTLDLPEHRALKEELRAQAERVGFREVI